MSNFARVLKPHLEAHEIDDAEELAFRMRAQGFDVYDDQVERWLSDEPQPVTFEDLERISYVLDLGDADQEELYREARRDSRLRTERSQEEKRRFDEIVEGFEQDSG